VQLLIGYGLFFLLLTLQDRSGGPQTVSYTEFTRQVETGNVEQVFTRGDTIQGELRNSAQVPGAEGETYQQFVTERPTFAQDDLLADLEASGATVRATPVVQDRGVLANLLFSLAPMLLLVAFYFWIFKRQGQAMGAGLFGGGKKKPVDPEEVRVSFDDVAGIDEVEAEISEVVDFLRDPAKYRRVGARAPKGVLLAGAPGTGKTLLARATAGEANVPFFSASASEFIEMIVGVGASRVRELFAEARKVAPAIIFIDEIDTIGRARGGHAPWAATMSASRPSTRSSPRWTASPAPRAWSSWRRPTALTSWTPRCCGPVGSTARSWCTLPTRRGAPPSCACTRATSRWPSMSTSISWLVARPG
jgi:cell division protease FtsH